VEVAAERRGRWRFATKSLTRRKKLRIETGTFTFSTKFQSTMAQPSGVLIRSAGGMINRFADGAFHDRDAPVFVEFGKTGIAVSDAVRHRLAVQSSS
jgi:hypothetical protein